MPGTADWGHPPVAAAVGHQHANQLSFEPDLHSKNQAQASCDSQTTLVSHGSGATGTQLSKCAQFLLSWVP